MYTERKMDMYFYNQKSNQYIQWHLNIRYSVFKNIRILDYRIIIVSEFYRKCTKKKPISCNSINVNLWGMGLNANDDN